jgi:hypothetical protein
LAVAKDYPKNNVVGLARTGATLLHYDLAFTTFKVPKYLVGFDARYFHQLCSLQIFFAPLK